MIDYRSIIMKYRDIPGGLIQAFHAIQDECSYLPEDAIIEASKVFGLPTSEVFGVATFYSYLSVEPRGKHIIRMCRSAPCHIAGAAQIMDHLQTRLGIRAGETTGDGRFTLEFTECIGQCHDTPVISVDGKAYTGMTVDKVDEMLSSFK